MSADLRQLMRELADDAPTMGDRIAMADVAYTGGRRRRRMRHLEITGAATVVVLCALLATLFVGTSPLAARYGASSATSVSGYPSRIGQQWPILDLPAKPGPIAGLLGYGDGWWAVSPTGHRWKVPGMGSTDGATPAVSPDGRMIGYLEHAEGPYVVRDLVSGAVVRAQDIGAQSHLPKTRFGTFDELPAYFSSDDRYLGFSGLDNGRQRSLVVDTRTGRVVGSFNDGQFVAGWTGSSLVTISLSTHVATSRSLVGGPPRSTTLRPTGALVQSGQFTVVVSTDGARIAYLAAAPFDEPATTTRLTTFDLSSGAQLGRPDIVPSISDVGGYAYGRSVAYLHHDAGTGADVVVKVDADGRPTTATTIESGNDVAAGVWAAYAYDGTARPPMPADRVANRVLVWRTALLWTLVVLLALGCLFWIWSSAQRKAAPAEVEATTTTAGSRRVRRLTVVGVLGAIAVLVAVYVVRVGTTGNLTASQPALWWSAADQALATTGASQGDPASVVPLRATAPATAQGFLVLVENRTGRSQRIVASEPGAYTTAVATTRGTESQARSLVYAASGTVPARQSRWVRVLLNVACVDKGTSVTLPNLALDVHIGWLSRKVNIPFRPQMKLVAKTKIAPANQNCDG